MQAPETSDIVREGQDPFGLKSVMLPVAIGLVPAAVNLKCRIVLPAPLAVVLTLYHTSCGWLFTPHSTGLAYPKPVEVVAFVVVPLNALVQVEFALNVSSVALQGSSLEGTCARAELKEYKKANAVNRGM